MITKQTGLSIGLVLAVLGSGLFGWDRLDERLTGIETELREQRYLIRSIIERQGDRWTASDMSIWVERLKSKNPTLDMPEIRDLLEDER